MKMLLNNGAEIIAKKPVKGGGYIVMAKRDAAYHPFVTWFVDYENDAFHGHYFSDEGEAMDDFFERK